MSEVELILPGSDRAFFIDHPDRHYRIRLPVGDEYRREFLSLGPHNEDRERVLVARTPRNVRRQSGVALMPIPMLARADETIEDRDDVLGPIFHQIMQAAAAGGRQ